jgi:hypothetical protein
VPPRSAGGDEAEGLVKLMAGRRALCGVSRVRSSSVGILRLAGTSSPVWKGGHSVESANGACSTGRRGLHGR